MFIVLRPGVKTDMKNGQKNKDYNVARMLPKAHVIKLKMI